MEQQILGFREQVESYFGGRPKRGDRYSAILKEQAVALALDLGSQGERLGAVATTLGVGVGTLQRWVEATPHGPSRMRKVEVVETDGSLIQDQGSSKGLTLATASGHRVEGLALPEVVLLLEALG